MLPTPTRHFMPPAATGWSASGRDRMPGTQPGDTLRVSARHNASAGDRAAVERLSGAAIRDGTTRFAGLSVLVPTHRHADVTSELIMEVPHLAGNLFHDAHTAILTPEHGIRQIYTRDTDFNQFTFAEIINPSRL